MEINEVKPITDEEVIKIENNLSAQLIRKQRWGWFFFVVAVIFIFWITLDFVKFTEDVTVFSMYFFIEIIFLFAYGFNRDEKNSLQLKLDNWKRRTKKLNKESSDYLNYLKLVNQIPELKDFHKVLDGKMPRVIDLEKVREVEVRLKLRQKETERRKKIADLEKELSL